MKNHVCVFWTDLTNVLNPDDAPSEVLHPVLMVFHSEFVPPHCSKRLRKAQLKVKKYGMSYQRHNRLISLYALEKVQREILSFFL